IAFVSLPVEVRGVQTERLFVDELIAIASPQHPQAAQRVVSSFALAGEKLILGERGGNTRRLIDEFFAQAGLHPKVAMELSRLSAIIRMVEEGMGVGIVPFQSALGEIAEGRLVRWWIEGAHINSELGLAYLTGGYHSPVSQTFVKLCREYFAQVTSAAQARREALKGTKAKTGKRRK
ncbi:MAG: LysR family transcriptional regulator substrate-binding protein, partial [Pyrinomonadaceae bacterium]